MTSQEILLELEKNMRTRVLCEHAYGAEALLELTKEKISNLRLKLIARMPDSVKDEGVKSLDNNLERLYDHCRRQYEG